VGNKPLNVVSNGDFVFVITLIGVVPNEGETDDDDDEGTSTDANASLNTGIKMNNAQRRCFEDVTKTFLLRKLSSSKIFTAIQSVGVRVIDEDYETSTSTATTPGTTTSPPTTTTVAAAANPRRSNRQLLRGSRSQSRRLQDLDKTASADGVGSGRIEIVTEVTGEWTSSSSLSLQETRALTLQEIGEHPKEYMNEFLKIGTTQQQQQQQMNFSRPGKRNDDQDYGKFFSGLTDVRVKQRPQTAQPQQHLHYPHSHPYLLANNHRGDRSTSITLDENINRSRSRIAQEVDNKTTEVTAPTLLITCIVLIVLSLLFIMYRFYMDCFYSPEVETINLDNHKKEEEKIGPITPCLEELGIPIPWNSKSKAPAKDPQLVQGDGNDNKSGGGDGVSRSLDKGSTSKDNEASSLTVDGNTKHSNHSRADKPRSQKSSNINEDDDDNDSLDSSPSFHSSDSRSRLSVGEQKVPKGIRSKQQNWRQVDGAGKVTAQRKLEDPDLKSSSSKSVPLEQRDGLELGANKKMPLSKSLHTPDSEGIVKKQKKKQKPADQKEHARTRMGKRNGAGTKKQKPLSKSSTHSTSTSQEAQTQGGPDLKSISTKSAPPLERYESPGTAKKKKPLSKSLHNKGSKSKASASGSRIARAKNNKQAPIDEKSKTAPARPNKK